MHMSNALISPAVGITMYAVSFAAVSYSAIKTDKSELCDKKIPFMGIMGAFVFAAQMVNFVIPGTGSSGHIGGGILLAALLGGLPAFLTISAVLAVQCLFFADGGLLALGCNIFNMGIIPCLLAYPLIFKPILKSKTSNMRLAVAAVGASVISLQLGALGVVLQTQLSGITALPFGEFLTRMQPLHLAIGIAEGLITAAILCVVNQTNPGVIDGIMIKSNASLNAKPVSVKKLILPFAIATIITGGGLSLVASELPDGLESSVSATAGTELEDNGKLAEGATEIQMSFAYMPDYNFKTLDNSTLGTSVSGITGGAAAFMLTAAAGISMYMLKRRN